MRAVVTGGSGFVGSHVVEHLLADGHEVFIVDSVYTDGSRVAGARLDITDRDGLIDLFGSVRPDFVYHLAGIADARQVLADPVRGVTVNVGGTAAVLEASAKAGAKRVVVASSAWLDNALDGPGQSTDLLRPDGGGHVYTTSLIAREFLANDFRKQCGLGFTILRYSPLYGRGMWPGLAVRSFLEAAADGGPLRVFGDGLSVRRYLYVEDLASAFSRCTRHSAADSVFTVRGPEAVSVRDLATAVSELFGGVPIVYEDAPERRGELRGEEAPTDTDRAKLLGCLGWEPTTVLKEGLLNIVDDYRHVSA
jgi:nucleoside-diphosphate-sugar epimerase